MTAAKNLALQSVITNGDTRQNAKTLRQNVVINGGIRKLRQLTNRNDNEVLMKLTG